MSLSPLENCPLTRLNITNSAVTAEYFEYQLLFNGNSYTIKLSVEIPIKSGIIQFNGFDEVKLSILQAMLYNNEWPIDKDDLITANLINQIIKFAEYPRDFEQKMDYYILKVYLRGGKEYKEYKFSIGKYQDFFAFNKEEGERILKGMKSQGLVTYDSNVHHSHNKIESLILTEAGRKRGKELDGANKEKKGINFHRRNSPKILIICTKEDEKHLTVLSQILQKAGISIMTIPPIERDDKFFTVASARQYLYSQETDFIIFIKSENSDKNNNYGSVLDIAIEAHENTERRNEKFIFFAFTDDSPLESRPRLINYNHDAIDIRIKSNRDYILQWINNNYGNRSIIAKTLEKKAYNFPQIHITNQERIWLEAIYIKFLRHEKFEYRELLSKMWDELPENFDPKKIHPSLIKYGNEITLLGICTIDPNSKIIEHFDNVVYAIRNIIKAYGSKDIKSSDIIDQNSQLDFDVIYQVFKILFQLGYTTSIGSSQDQKTCSISVNDDVIYERYRNYNGIESLIQEVYNNSNSQNDKKDIAQKKTNGITTDAYKTKFNLRDTKNINPVMGVLDLSNDLAEIIDSLPDEKGQMVGIFGKWGRGKTFLMNELWFNLSIKKTKYIKLEFHAWKYQETPASWAYLYEIFSKAYLGKKNINYYYKLFKLNKIRHGYWPIIKFLLLLSFFLSFSIYIPAILENYPKVNNWYVILGAFSFLGISFISLINLLYKEFKVKALDLIKKYSYKNSFKENLGLQADIQDELIKLLKAWIPNPNLNKTKIILFVEDIDRCTEDKIIQNIDALRILLEDEEISKRVIIITAIDERILKNAIEIKYKSIFDNTSNSQKISGLVSEYLDKLFISAVKLGELTIDQKSQYFSELIKQEVDSQTMIEAFNLSVSEHLTKKQKITNPEKDIQNEPLGPKDINKNTFSSVDSTNKVSVIFDNNSRKENERILNERYEAIKREKEIAKSKFEKLTAKEVFIMDSIISKWKGATPRRIRIFYYRYLLSKNLLIDKYITLNEKNIWEDEQGIKSLMYLILKYSKTTSAESISKKKNNIAHIDDEEIDIEIEGKKITVERLHFLKLLEVLELVIAY